MLGEKARIFIFVKDLDGNPLPEASVKIRNGGDERQINYNKAFQKFMSDSLTPDTYELEIKDRSGLESNRTIVLEKGDNYFFSTLTGSDTPYYLAAGGEKIYIKKEKDQKLLFARGKELHKKLPSILQKIGLKIGKDVIPFEKNKQPDSGMFFVPFPKSIDRRRRIFKILKNVIEKRFPKAGLSGKLAAAMRRGKENVEGLTNELTVKFKPGVTEEKAQNIASKYGFQVAGKVQYLENAYLFRLGELPNYDLLEKALRLDKEESIIYAEPKIIFQIEPASEPVPYEPNDFLFREQTHYQLIKAGKAWAELGNEGDPNITIAVIDTGAVDPRHPDIKGKIVANYDFVENTCLTEDSFNRELRKNSHGTQCASIAAGASDNNVGAVGLAGNCSLIGARIGNSMGIDEVAKVWLWAAGLETEGAELPARGADVISNSWNWKSPNMRSLEEVAAKLTSEGRGGKGCVICFSISNDGYGNFENNHSYLCTDKMIKVGASINLNPTDPVQNCRDEIPEGQKICADTRALYSPYGHALDIVAPSSTAISMEEKDIDPILSAVIKKKGDLIGPEVVPNENPTTLKKRLKGNNTKQIEVEVENLNAFKPGISIMIGELKDESYDIKTVDAVKIDEANDRKLLLITGIKNDYESLTKIYCGDANYSKQFGGTSHACAVVAGAAALIISTNCELTWREVKEILCLTAEQIDAGQINETGKWEQRDGKMFSPWYGFGRLDIYAAIKEAKARLENPSPVAAKQIA